MILDTAELGPGRANFYARLPGSPGREGDRPGAPHGRGHRHAEALDRWIRSPVRSKDGYVWGRGALDMKGHGDHPADGAHRAQAGRRAAHPRPGLRGQRRRGDRRPRLAHLHRAASRSGEPHRVRAHRGRRHRVEKGKVRWFGIDVGEKRTWWKKLVARGTTSHGSVPLGDNPVDRLVRALDRIVA